LELRAQSRGFDLRRPGDAVAVAIDGSRAMIFDATGDGVRIA
jgi:hypothetical protein